jgi:hypothetical protein
MELNPGEERLRPTQTRPGVKGNKGLMTAHVQTFGKGPVVRSNPDFRASLTRIRDGLPPRSPATPSPSSTAQGVPPNAKTLSDLCYVLRSKNAGPYEITLDAIFVSEAAYRYARESGVLLPENVAKAIGVPLEDIIWQGFYEPALSFKVTIPRYRDGRKSAAGGFGENDVHASQKHMGLALIKLPEKSTRLSLQSLKNIGAVNGALVATALGIGGWSLVRGVLKTRHR